MMIMMNKLIFIIFSINIVIIVFFHAIFLISQTMKTQSSKVLIYFIKKFKFFLQ